jgi:general secretion pathway protein A
MYTHHFGLKELPFSIAPDPRYLFMSEQHREALAHLMYGINTDGGFVLLTGDVGTGKTTVSRCFLEQIPDNVNIALILNPKVTAEELLATVCDELQIPYITGCTSVKIFVDVINAFLLDAHSLGRKTVLLIDEAQNLEPDVLEQIRLLTNLETNEQKLLQIVMIGQPELRDMLSRPEMSQLSQRITARYHMGPLSKTDVGAYVNHRLFVAGASYNIFPVTVIRKLHSLSRGVPRLINIICDRALLGAYVLGKLHVDRKILVRAAGEVLGKPGVQQKRTLTWSIAALVFIICGTALAATWYYQKTPLFLFETSVTSEEEAESTAAQNPDSLDWPVGVPVESSKGLAYRALFQEWSIPYSLQEPDDACRSVWKEDLRCLEKKGDLKTLRILNRPAVLKLHDNQEREYFVFLKEMKGQSAVIVVGQEPRNVEAAEIEKRWKGEYLLLWRAPKYYSGGIYPGNQGPIVRWLDNQMTRLSGIQENPNPADIYHDGLVERVKKFQSSEGLEVDGIVGSQTFICILNKSGTNEPFLSR